MSLGDDYRCWVCEPRSCAYADWDSAADRFAFDRSMAGDGADDGVGQSRPRQLSIVRLRSRFRLKHYGEIFDLQDANRFGIAPGSANRRWTARSICAYSSWADVAYRPSRARTASRIGLPMSVCRCYWKPGRRARSKVTRWSALEVRILGRSGENCRRSPVFLANPVYL